MADESRSVDDPAAKAATETDAPKKKGKGFLSRLWNGIFWRRGEDFEKRLQYLSKEEAAVHARMKRRAQGWRKMARNVVVCCIVAELFAVIYAIIATRAENLRWQTRALKVSPMFLLPALSYVIYSTLASFTRMRDRKDQKTLENLRAERQAKIDELKERTNYYITQQLIQKYDLDPAAKAAAATVLASKLGAESGLKVLVGDAQKNEPSGRSHDVLMVPSDSLRNRKQSGGRSISPTISVAESLVGHTEFPHVQQAPVPHKQFVEHYKGSGANEGGWIARLAAMLVGEDPTQSYALICGNCRMHNGLARKEDYAHILYYCPHCHALNGHRQVEEQGPVSGSSSRSTGSPAPGSADVTPKVGSTSSAITEDRDSSVPPTDEPTMASKPTEDRDRSFPPTDEPTVASKPTVARDSSVPPTDEPAVASEPTVARDSSVPPTDEPIVASKPTEARDSSVPPTDEPTVASEPTVARDSSVPPTDELTVACESTLARDNSVPPTDEPIVASKPTEARDSSVPPTNELIVASEPKEARDSNVPPTDEPIVAIEPAEASGSSIPPTDEPTVASKQTEARDSSVPPKDEPIMASEPTEARDSSVRPKDELIVASEPTEARDSSVPPTDEPIVASELTEARGSSIPQPDEPTVASEPPEARGSSVPPTDEPTVASEPAEA